MSTPDDPTRRIPPTRPQGQGAPPPGRDPAGRPPVEREREREVIEDDPAWRAHVTDQLKTLRALLLGVALVALVALGLGIYLLATDDNGNGDAASERQVRQLDRQVDRLQSQVEEQESDVQELQERQATQANRISALEDQDPADTGQLEEAIDGLSNELEQLSRRVDQVEEQQE